MYPFISHPSEADVPTVALTSLIKLTMLAT